MTDVSKIKYRIQLGTIIILAVFAISLLLSQKANPDSSALFALKRVQEKVYLKLKSNPASKVDYMSFMLDSRAQELDNIVENKSYGQVLKASLRYSTLAGQITEIIAANNLTDKVQPIKAQFLNHQKIIYATYVFYPKNLPENEEWKYILDDVNYLKLYLDQLEKV